MGFTNDENGSGSGMFANFKEGKIITKIDGEKKTFSTLTGQIVDIDILDEKYQDKTYRKVVLFMAHEDGVTQLGFPMTSGYGWGFFQMCGNIDVKKEVSISGGVDTDAVGKSKKYGRMFIKQGGGNLKWLLKKDSEAAKKIPEVKIVKVGKQEVKNYEARDEYMEKVITAFYKKVQKEFPEGASAFKKAKHVDADSITEPIGDLPF